MDFELIRKGDSQKICYLLLPEGPCSEARSWQPSPASMLSDSTLVLVHVPNWNDDMTPWPAPGVFKKAKPFGGKAEAFLAEFEKEIIAFESGNGRSEGPVSRTLLGLSLSGLFAIWAAHRSGLFSRIISISGSLWFDGFAQWVKDQSLSPAVGEIVLTIGDRENNSKEPRMAGVVDITSSIARHFSCTRLIIEPGVTHFTPVRQRLEIL